VLRRSRTTNMSFCGSFIPGWTGARPMCGESEAVSPSQRIILFFTGRSRMQGTWNWLEGRRNDHILHRSPRS
jgi:hypothetical protein